MCHRRRPSNGGVNRPRGVVACQNSMSVQVQHSTSRNTGPSWIRQHLAPCDPSSPPSLDLICCFALAWGVIRCQGNHYSNIILLYCTTELVDPPHALHRLATDYDRTQLSTPATHALQPSIQPFLRRSVTVSGFRYWPADARWTRSSWRETDKLRQNGSVSGAIMPDAPPLPTRFPCWCRAVYSWGGEVCGSPEHIM